MISLAEAHLIDHDLSQATDAGSQAVFLAEHSASRRVRRRLKELSEQLSAHDTTQVSDVIQQITAYCR